MTLTELRYIVTLAREQHFGHAAEKCFVSQPTLSIAVKKLEEELGVPLFERSKNSVRVTPVGEKVVKQAQRVLEQADTIKDLALEGKDQLKSPLRVGAIYTIGPYLFPHLVAEVQKLAPEMPLYIEENFTESLRLKIRNVLESCPTLSQALHDQHTITEGSSLETIRMMVGSGLGCSVLPQSAVYGPATSDLVVTRPFNEPVPQRTVGVAWRASYPRPQAIDVLVDAISSFNPAMKR